MILKGPIKRGLNLPFRPKRITPFQRDTLRNTRSPTSKVTGLHLTSTYILCLSLAAFKFSRATLTLSAMICTISSLKIEFL